MTKRFIIMLFAVFLSANVNAQPRSLGARDVVLDDNAGNISYITTLLGGVGINQVNAMPHPCAILDLNSTTKGFLAPRLGLAEIAALCGGAPPAALMVYNTSTGNFNIWNGTRYMAPWQTSGNLGTNSSIDFIGTADAADFVLRTNNVERMRLTGNPITNSSVAPLMTISNPTLNQQGLRLNGTTDALFGHTLAANPGVWDLVVNGDAVVSGLFKIGASIWVDGFTPNNHRILANDDLTIGTNAAGQNLTLTTGPGGVINVNSPLILGGSPMDITVNNNTFALRAVQNGTGNSSIFQIANPANNASVTTVATNGIGSGITVQLTNAANGARGIDVLQAGVGPGVFATSAGGNAVWGITSSISAAGVIGDNTFGEAVVGRNRGGNGVGAVVGRNDSSGYGVRGFNTKNGIGVLGQSGISGGTGNAGRFENVNAANTNSTLDVATNGIGSGIEVQLTNAANGARGIDVLQAGVGPGVFATSAGGNALWGITSSISAAGVIGDNTFGEAVVGRNRGGNGVGAVVGRNDSSGYGVRGFNTKDGIGVLGQSGISGGTGVGGRFENVNAANSNDALQAATNGTGWAGNFTNTNNSSASRGVRISTTAGQGGNALTLANGTVSLSRQNPYASNTVVDDAILVVTAIGNVTVPTGPPLVDGATVWVVNNSGGVVTVTNTTVGAFNINPGRAVQLLFVSTVSGANWIPVQP